MRSYARMSAPPLLVMLTIAACSDDATDDGTTASSTTTSSSTTGTAGAGGDASTSSTSSGPVGCEPACVAPQFCSVQNQCLDPGQCLDVADCTEPGTTCDTATETCVPGGGCDALEAAIAPIPPNLLLVLDRSCSMTQGAGNGMTKWKAAVDAIVAMTTVHAGKLRFGLSVFPDIVAPSCSQDAIVIPPGENNEAAIQAFLTSALAQNDPYFPDGPCVTNIDTAIEQASVAPELKDPTRDNYVVLLTDGAQSSNCADAGGDAGTTMLLGQMFAAGLPTYVIGFGNGVDAQALTAFANAGGVPNATPPYYDAADPTALDMALDTIATSAIGCSFALDATPPNVDDIAVFFDGTAVDKDPTKMDGWFYDANTNTIEFFGAACDSLKSGSVMNVDVVLGCAVE